MSKFMLLLWTRELTPDELAGDEMKAWFQEYIEWTRELEAAGALVMTESLAPTATSATVEVRDGQQIVSDGPFAETKEQILGFFLIEAEDFDAAVQWAAKSPAAKHGSIEVRPLNNAREMMEAVAAS
ncbi:MAG: YciI family protein [Solirubrobacterales bacterium]